MTSAVSGAVCLYKRPFSGYLLFISFYFSGEEGAGALILSQSVRRTFSGPMLLSHLLTLWSMYAYLFRQVPTYLV